MLFGVPILVPSLGMSHSHPTPSEDEAAEHAKALAGHPRSCCPGPSVIRVILIICIKFP